MTDIVTEPKAVTVPKLNNNDESYILVEWVAGDGDLVDAGDVLAVIETSKAATDLVAEDRGVMHRLVAESAECRPGQVIARLFDDEDQLRDYVASASASAADRGDRTAAGAAGDLGTGEPVLTRAARELVERHGIGAEALRALGKPLLKGADVAHLANGDRTDESADTGGVPADPGPGTTVRLDRRQLGVASVVARSHRTVPTATATIRIDAGPARAAVARHAERTGISVGLPELAVLAIAACYDRHPLFFASVPDPFDGTVVVPNEPSVGVTMDAGQGLFIPLIRSVRQLSLDEVAARLADFRIAALRADFDEADLAGTDAGGSIVLSLNNADDIVHTTPIVFPGNACMVWLGGLIDEVALDADDQPIRRTVCHIGVAYDHRVINGRVAVEFLHDIKAGLESEAWSSDPGTRP